MIVFSSPMGNELLNLRTISRGEKHPPLFPTPYLYCLAFASIPTIQDYKFGLYLP